MSLHDDPVGWAKSAVGTPTRLTIILAVHLIAAAVCSAGPLLDWVSEWTASYIGGFMSFYSILYLLALKGVLRELSPPNPATSPKNSERAA
jgi:hypothetical protein